jgi:TonB family protein
MRSFVLLLLSCPLLAQAPAEPADARGWLNQGVQQFKSARYDEAVRSFQRAVDLEPNNVSAHLYLATAWMTQYIPGADSPANAALAQNAEREFQNVLNLDAKNVVALQSLASLTFMRTQSNRNESEKARLLTEAEGYYRRLLEVNADNREALYSLGVIAWTRVYPNVMQARARLGMRPEDAGPLRDAATRADLRSRFQETLAEGMSSLEKALQIDSNYDDAMAYLNLMYRLQADLSDTAEEHARLTGRADEWVQKALETKRRKVGMGMQASGSVPPPPPQAPGQATPPGVIRVGGNVQSQKLIFKPQPLYPVEAKEARIQGLVRFEVRISETGEVAGLTLVSGHPLLVPSATEAVRQWRYQPTLLNGNPVQVQTLVDVNYTLAP